jgi:hypothetical protein
MVVVVVEETKMDLDNPLHDHMMMMLVVVVLVLLKT